MQKVKLGDIVRYRGWKPGDPNPDEVEEGLHAWGTTGLVISLREKERFKDKESQVMRIIDMVLSNSQAGLIDLNLNQQQKVLQASCFPYILSDYSTHILYGSPKQGQSLDELKDLLIAEVQKVKNGDFPDWLLPAIISDMKLSKIKVYESNSSRANEFVQAFIQRIEWKDYVKEIEVLESINKEEVMEVAKKYYQDNYVYV